jgi:hypothetical protein
MRYSGQTLMSLGVMVTAAYAVITALKWPLLTAIFPVVIGIAVFSMGMVELLFSRRETKETPEKGSFKATKPLGEDLPLPIARALLAFMLILSLFIFILLLGFLIGIPLFTFLYLKIYGREKWPISLVVAFLVWATLYGFFVRMMNIPFPDGWVQHGLEILGIE